MKNFLSLLVLLGFAITAHAIPQKKPCCGSFVVIDGVTMYNPDPTIPGTNHWEVVPLPHTPSAFTWGVVTNADGSVSNTIEHDDGEGGIVTAVIDIPAPSTLTAQEVCAAVLATCPTSLVPDPANPGGGFIFTGTDQTPVVIPPPATPTDAGDFTMTPGVDADGNPTYTFVHTKSDSTVGTPQVITICDAAFKEVVDRHGTVFKNPCGQQVLHRTLTVTDKHTGSTGVGDIAVSHVDSNDGPLGPIDNHHLYAVDTSTGSTAGGVQRVKVVASQDTVNTANRGFTAATLGGTVGPKGMSVSLSTYFPDINGSSSSSIGSTFPLLRGNSSVSVGSGRAEIPGNQAVAAGSAGGGTGLLNLDGDQIFVGGSQDVTTTGVLGAGHIWSSRSNNIGANRGGTISCQDTDVSANNATAISAYASGALPSLLRGTGGTLLGTSSCDNGGNISGINHSKDSVIAGTNAVLGGAIDCSQSLQYDPINNWVRRQGYAAAGTAPSALNGTISDDSVTGDRFGTGTVASGAPTPGFQETLRNLDGVAHTPGTKLVLEVTADGWGVRAAKPGEDYHTAAKARSACAFLAESTLVDRFARDEFGAKIMREVTDEVEYTESITPAVIEQVLVVPVLAEGEKPDPDAKPEYVDVIVKQAEPVMATKEVTYEIPTESEEFIALREAGKPNPFKWELADEYTIVEALGQVHVSVDATVNAADIDGGNVILKKTSENVGIIWANLSVTKENIVSGDTTEKVATKR